MDIKPDNSFIRQIYQLIKGSFDSLTKAVNSTHKVEIQGAEIVTIKGQKGDNGHTPTNDELLTLIKPLIPKITQPKDGHTPTDEELLTLIRPLIPEVKDGETPSDARLLALIKTLIPKIDTSSIAIEASKMAQDALKPLIPTIPEQDTPEQIADKLGKVKKQWLDIDAIKGDFNTKVIKQFGSGGKIDLQVTDDEGENFYVDKIKFSGSGVTLDSLGNKVAQVTISEGVTEVFHDGTMTGKGTEEDPLSVLNQGVVEEIVAGSYVVVDNTNPAIPIVGVDGVEPDLGFPDADNYILQSTVDGVRSWVSPSSAGITVEIPTETPDSVITEFVVSAEPKWVVSDGMTYFAGVGYTYTTNLVTMDLAPSYFIRVII